MKIYNIIMLIFGFVCIFLGLKDAIDVFEPKQVSVLLTLVVGTYLAAVGRSGSA